MEHEEEKDYRKSVTVVNFWSNSYIEHESNSGKNKTLSIGEYLIKISPYLENIISDLKKVDTWKTQRRIAINLVSFKDNDEEGVMHSKSDNVEMMITDKEDEVI